MRPDAGEVWDRRTALLGTSVWPNRRCHHLCPRWYRGGCHQCYQRKEISLRVHANPRFMVRRTSGPGDIISKAERRATSPTILEEIIRQVSTWDIKAGIREQCPLIHLSFHPFNSSSPGQL